MVIGCCLFQVAIVKMDEKVRDRINILNLLRYETVKKQKRLDEIKTQYKQMEKESAAAVETDIGESEEAQVMYFTVLIYTL